MPASDVAGQMPVLIMSRVEGTETRTPSSQVANSTGGRLEGGQSDFRNRRLIHGAHEIGAPFPRGSHTNPRPGLPTPLERDVGTYVATAGEVQVGCRWRTHQEGHDSLDFILDGPLGFFVGFVVFFSVGMVFIFAANWLGKLFGLWTEEDKNGWRDVLRSIVLLVAFFAGPIVTYVLLWKATGVG